MDPSLIEPKLLSYPDPAQAPGLPRLRVTDSSFPWWQEMSRLGLGSKAVEAIPGTGSLRLRGI